MSRGAGPERLPYPPRADGCSAVHEIANAVCREASQLIFAEADSFTRLSALLVTQLCGGVRNVFGRAPRQEPCGYLLCDEDAAAVRGSKRLRGYTIYLFVLLLRRAGRYSDAKSYYQDRAKRQALVGWLSHWHATASIRLAHIIWEWHSHFASTVLD